MDLKGAKESIASKVKGIRNCLELAKDCLSNKDYYNAQMVFASVLSDLQKETFLTAGQFNDLEYFSMQICFAYSTLANNAMCEDTLVLLNSLYEGIKMPLVPLLKAFVHIANNRLSFASDQLQLCHKLIKDGYNFKPNPILNDEVIPEVHIEFLKLKLNGLSFACHLLQNNSENDPFSLNQFKSEWLKLGHLCQIDFAKFDEAETNKKAIEAPNMEEKTTKAATANKAIKPKEVAKNEPQKKTQGAVKKKLEESGKTDATKTCFTQTTNVKFTNASVQAAEKDCSNPVNKQFLATLSEIKNKVNLLHTKKDTDIKQMRQINKELNDNILERESSYQEKCVELNFLKKQHSDMETKLEKSEKQVVFLQKLLFEQIQHSYQLQKNICTRAEETCIQKIDYLNDIANSLRPPFKLMPFECKQESYVWKNCLNNILASKNNCEMHYKNAHSCMFEEKLSMLRLSDWPQIPALPTGGQDLIYRFFKNMLQDFPIPPPVMFHNVPNSISYPPCPPPPIVYQQPSMPNQNYRVPFGDGRTTGSPISYQNQNFNLTPPIRVPNNPNNNHNKKSQNGAIQKPQPQLQPRPKAETSACNLLETETELLEFLKSKLENMDEILIFEAVSHIRDQNNGSLSGIPRDKLVEDIRKSSTNAAWLTVQTNKSAYKGNPWKITTPTPEEDADELKCCICFEDFSVDKKFALPCRHEFHSKCIQNWLKRHKTCPVCRVHTEVDLTFPPL